MSRWIRLLLFGLACLAGPVLLAQDDEGIEIGILGGVVFSDDDLVSHSRALDPRDLTLGLRTGVFFARRWEWYLETVGARVSTQSPLGTAELITARTGVDLLFNPGQDRRSYLAFGGGLLHVDYDGGDFRRPMVSLGVGHRAKLGDSRWGRMELRADHSLDDDKGPIGEDIDQVSLVFGLSWGPTAAAGADADGDGVSDGRDRCPGTPRGATVDEHGCPKDGDGDGVFDGIDRCPDTTRGWPVDGSGCPKDSDGDGVPDGADRCPDTPSGATVDAAGCPKDGDGDGVFDGVDRCPGTPAGASVDAAGCPKDSDSDGVFDGVDRCPKTLAGASVDATGCPTDSDGDGVFDGIDRCPNTPAGKAVDSTGCPLSDLVFDETRKTLVLEGVTFELDSARLTATSRSVLDRVARSLADWPDLPVEVGGHTDSSGSDSYNLDLSKRRAEAVWTYLLEQGVASSRMVARGYGESQPVADNAAESGRTQNRRVELKRLD